MSLLSGVSRRPLISGITKLKVFLSSWKARPLVGLFYTALKTLTGECVTTRQVAIKPLRPTKIIPSNGPASHRTGLK